MVKEGCLLASFRKTVVKPSAFKEDDYLPLDTLVVNNVLNINGF